MNDSEKMKNWIWIKTRHMECDKFLKARGTYFFHSAHRELSVTCSQPPFKDQVSSLSKQTNQNTETASLSLRNTGVKVM